MSDWRGVQPEEQRIVRTVRKFVKDVVSPQAAELDRAVDPTDSFSWDIVEGASEIGIRTLTLEQEYGGLGADSLTTAVVLEELARGDLGVAVIFAQTLKLVQTLQKAATKEQRERYLPRFRDDPRFLLAIGITEPETSSNYIIPYDHPEAPYQTTATRKDGGWIIDGMKHFISNGNRASLYLIFAQTERGKSLVEGSTCFLVERDRPGFSIGRVHDKMGERLVNNAELVLQGCFVPDENILGQVGAGFNVLAQFFPASNAYAAASVLGVGEAAYARALDWASTREQGGRQLIEHDGIAAELATMRMQLDAARAYIHKVAWAADHPEAGWEPTMGALPKVFASQVAWDVVSKTLELHGGYGYIRDVGIEKLVRDAAAFLHSDGANRSLLLKAARFIRQTS